MKKVYLKGYLYFNLGDDLFFHIITKRYENVRFMSLTRFNYNIGKNIKFVNYNKIKIIDKIIKLFSFKKSNFESSLIKNNDMVVLIGGSMFIENHSNYSNGLFSDNKDYYILGSNFGPYKTNSFYKQYANIFSKAKDVCFRDKYSYNLFKNIPNIRMASDIAFSLDLSDINIVSEHKVIISIVDVSKKFGNDIKEKYIEKIVDMIKLFKQKNYSVTLMSFCKYEGDENAIKEIISNSNEKVDTYFYNGNIKQALEILGRCEIIVGTRFHANILGLIMNKTIIPIAYSDKTINVLNDIGFKGKIFDIRDMESFDVSNITDNDLSYKLDVSLQVKDSEKHFQELDKILKENDKNEK